MYFSIGSFNSVISLKNSEVPSSKTIFNGQLISTKTYLTSLFSSAIDPVVLKILYLFLAIFQFILVLML